MLILHLASEGGFRGVLRPWVEADAEGRDLARELRRKPPKVTVKAPECPYNGGPELLESVLPQAVLLDGWESGKEQWAVAWLPSDERGPIPSSSVIGPRSGRQAQRLAPWAVSTVAVNPRGLASLFLGYGRGEKVSPEWRLGEDLEFWRKAWELAGSMVVRQQYLPAVLETLEDPSRWWPTWEPVYDAEDLQRLELLAESMPVVARAVAGDPSHEPPDEPQRLVRDMIERLVECVVWMGHMTHEVSKHYLRRRRWWRPVHLHERWVETLMTPDLELKGKSSKLIALQEQTEKWRDAVFTSPPIEDAYPALPISLPPEGEDFWVGRELPDDFVGAVEAPVNPALILSRVGELPGWRGERMLRDSLEPVYDAASRYALEYVFRRK